MADEDQSRGGQQSIERGHGALAGVAIEIDEQVPAEDDIIRWPVAEEAGIEEVPPEEADRPLHRRIQGIALRALMEVARPERGKGPPERVQAVNAATCPRERPSAD